MSASSTGHYTCGVETCRKQEAVLACLDGLIDIKTGHCIATAIKYIDRMGLKDGETLEDDAYKAADYLHRAITGEWIPR